MNKSVLHLCFDPNTIDLDFYSKFIEKDDDVIVYLTEQNINRKEKILGSLESEPSHVYFQNENDFNLLLELTTKHEKIWTWK